MGSQVERTCSKAAIAGHSEEADCGVEWSGKGSSWLTRQQLEDLATDRATQGCSPGK